MSEVVTHSRLARRDALASVTEEQMATMDFEPWKHAVDEWTPPSNDEWGPTTRLLVPLRTAWLLMYKTKAELETVAETLEEEAFDEMFGGITEARQYFETIAGILTGAETRMLCSMASLGACPRNSGFWWRRLRELDSACV